MGVRCRFLCAEFGHIARDCPNGGGGGGGGGGGNAGKSCYNCGGANLPPRVWVAR